jgi:tricorn protease-like protein
MEKLQGGVRFEIFGYLISKAMKLLKFLSLMVTATTGILCGRVISYISDESGEYKLYVQPHDGNGKTRIFPLTGTGFYACPEWSPDSKYITFTDNGRNFYLLETSSGNIKKIDTDDLYFR